MELTKQQLTTFAKTLGLADVRYAIADDMPDTKGLEQPRELLDGAKSIIVMFAPYWPCLPPGPGHLALSAYYIASNSAYHAARAVTDFIKQHGARALHTDDLNAKGAALQTGGFIGDNGFYYHPEWGSLVSIQTVLTDAFEPDDKIQHADGCLHCGRCAAACPSQAVGHIEGCLRYHMDGLVPEALRGDIYQLLGCEKCQSACPLNDTARSEPISFTLEALLKGEATKALRVLAGPNMARRGRLISQAALYAATAGQTQLTELLKQLAQNEDEPVRSHARWAVDRLDGEHK